MQQEQQDETQETPKKRERKSKPKHYELNATELIKYLGLDAQEILELPIHAPLSKKQETFCNDYTNDIICFGGQAGSGKTQVSILKMLIGVYSDKNYAACITRQSKVQLKGSGSVFSTATKLFESAAGASTNKVELSWNFPEGQEIKALHLWDNQDDYQGQQVTAYFVDEATQCKEEDTVYLMSRLRSKAKMKHQLCLTTNPLYDSYLRVWLEKAGYLDEDGYPIKAMDGVSTYMLRINGDWQFRKSREEIAKEYGEDYADDAYSFVFYSAGVDDNPYIRKYLPEYIRKLDNLPELERKMLRHGCWKARPEASGYFKADWCKIIQPSQLPLGLRTIRSWDVAATLPDRDTNKNPDWTRGVKGCYDKETGIYYIIDMVSDRNRPAVIQNLIETTALLDGKNCYVALPKDPGAAGIEVLANKTARLGSIGAKVLVSKTRKSKFERAEAFLIAAQNGNVVLVEGAWNKDFLDEWSSFTGAGEKHKKDDICDATSDLIMHLQSTNLMPKPRFGNTALGNRLTARIAGSTLL